MKPAIKAQDLTDATTDTQEACTDQSGCCNKETQVYSRVVGYIRPTDHWNVAKKEEFEQRKTYTMPKEED